MALKPRTAELLKELDAIAQQHGAVLRLNSGERTCADQARVNPEQLCSYHLTGDAIDVQPIIYVDGRGPTLPREIPHEPPDSSRSVSLALNWRQILQAWAVKANSLGFRWGGNFAKPDIWHFDDGRRVRVSCCPGISPVDSGRRANRAGEAPRRVRGDGEAARCAERFPCDTQKRLSSLERIVRGLRCEKCRKAFSLKKGKRGATVTCGCTAG